MKLVFDTNVIVDVLINREPFFATSKKAMAAAARPGVSGAMTANSMTDIFYLLRKYQPDKSLLKKSLAGLMDYLEVLDTTRDLCRLALQSPMIDFEDALVAESARGWSADFIVTRDPLGFVDSPVKTITPEELLHRVTD
jgi:predicted nucleic acid-binding protein